MKNLNDLRDITENSLFELIQIIPNPVHIKDVQGKYIATNNQNLGTFGFRKAEELLGLSLDDLDYFMRQYWGKNFASSMRDFDAEAMIGDGKTIVKRKLFKDKNNFIRFQDVYKIPYFCKQYSNKVSFIITLSVELTDKLKLIELYNKYRALHCCKTDAMKYFLEYLGITGFFYEQLTEKELLCLLCARQNQAHKHIANNLGVTIKTVEAHVANIAGKLKNHSLHDVFAFLRDRAVGISIWT